MFHRILSSLTFLALLTIAPTAQAEIIRVNLLQLNDIYEITPVEGGRRGGLARVATLRQQLLANNPHTYTLLAGDLISPSALGTARVNGEPLAGAQIVATMNTLGLDYATFGNHEFDVSEAQLRARLAESEFQWFSSNVFERDGIPFADMPLSQTLTIPGQDGNQLRIGLVGATLTSNPKDYVQYLDPIEGLRYQVDVLKDDVDILVAVTHLSLSQDQQVAAQIPEIDLILGGHEHENIQQWRFDAVPDQPAGCPDRPTPIFKADANARTVYVHTLIYDTDTGCFSIDSYLQPITGEFFEDEPATAATVQAWVEQGFAGFRSEGFEPTETIATLSQSLDGLESSVRNQSTLLTEQIALGLLQAGDDADLAIYNSGSIRIDDILPPGPITQYDVIRILPFGGQVLTVAMPGALLERVLDQGIANRGSGGYLQTAQVTWNEAANGWEIQGKALDVAKTYRVAITDFLISGRETGLEYLTLDAPGVQLLQTGDDMRFAVIQQLQQMNQP